MKFEDALSFMRHGAKIRCPFMPKDEYYIACYVSLRRELMTSDQWKEYMLSDKPVSICWMKGEHEHPDMRPKWNPYDPKTDPCKHGMAPMINLIWLMSDDWEMIE